MNLPSHQLTWREFDAFCAGAVDEQVLSTLRNGQYSRRRLLLSALVEKAAALPEISGPLPTLEEAWQVLIAAEERDPVAVEDVVMWPTVGVWLARVLRRLHAIELAGPSLWVELGFLHSLAAAAATRVRLPCALELPVVDGVVSLPGVGRLDGTDFIPARRHESVSDGQRLTVELDDHTPYRRFSAPESPATLSDAELAAWRRDLDGAWKVLVRWHPDFAEELSAGLVTVTPIPSPSRVIGSSAPLAFGGVAVSRAGSPVALAETLVHELQHSKLNALLDLVVLLESDPADLAYAPWRDDPRPLLGLLHGIYAFTSVVEFWDVQRHHTDGVAGAFTFVRRHRQVKMVVEALAGARGLTEPGVRLVESTAGRLDRCPVDDVPDHVIAAAETIIADHRAQWRLRHVRPDERHVARVLAAWRAGAPPPDASSQSPVIEPDRRMTSPSHRIRLISQRMTDAPGFADPPDDADTAFAAGHLNRALIGYERRLTMSQDDDDAWVGLGLTMHALGGPESILLDAPEIAVAVREQIQEKVPPLEFAAWLAARPAKT